MRGKNIAQCAAILTLSLYLLSGCASKKEWTKPGFIPDEFKQDYYECDREANIMASQQAGAMSSAVNPLAVYTITKRKFFNNCMLARGYDVKPVSSAPVAPHSDTTNIVAVTWTSANIRSGAGNEFPVVEIVKQGDKLTLVGENREWFNVRLVNGKEGWINSRVVK